MSDATAVRTADLLSPDWWVDLDGKTTGPFPTEEEAHAAAVARATTFGDLTRAAEIYAPGPDGRFRLIFSRDGQSKAG